MRDQLINQYAENALKTGCLTIDLISLTLLDDILAKIEVQVDFQIGRYVRSLPLLLLHKSLPKSSHLDISKPLKKLKEAVTNCQPDLDAFQASKIKDRIEAKKVIESLPFDWKTALPLLYLLMDRSTDLEPYKDRLLDVHELINSVASTFCLAKWEEVTYLSNEGYSLSCCKARRNPMGDVSQNIQFFHNSPEKLKVRQDLLNGVKNSECDFCWLKEDSFLSERTIVSEWHMNYFYDVIESGLGENYVPSSVGLTSTQTCQLKCMYCSPQYSSSWESEIKQKGFYKLVKYDYNRTDFDVSESKNMELFWKLWPEWKKKANKITITGGEPLLSRDTWMLMDAVLDGSWKPLSFVINTNLDVPGKLIDTLIEQTKKLQPGVLTIATSGEAFGPQLEYVRYGMSSDRWLNNVKRFLSETEGVKVKLMTSINLLSYSTFTQLAKIFLDLRDLYGSRIEKITFKYLVSPEFLDARLLPKEVLEKFKSEMREMSNDPRLLAIEKVSINNLLTFLSTDVVDYDRHHKNMCMFFKEYDQRRGTDLAKTFPELVGIGDRYE